jgi:hypothetical protein
VHSGILTRAVHQVFDHLPAQQSSVVTISCLEVGSNPSDLIDLLASSHTREARARMSDTSFSGSISSSQHKPLPTQVVVSSAAQAKEVIKVGSLGGLDLFHIVALQLFCGQRL